MKLNRKLVLVLALLVSVIMATTGTLAYLTDRETVRNVFKVGPVDIELEEKFEDYRIWPGQTTTKEAQIKNIGDEPAWVWMTVSVPDELHPYVTPVWTEEYEAYVTGDSPVLGTTDDDNPVQVQVYTVLVPKALAAKTLTGEIDTTGNILAAMKLSDLVDYQDGKYVVVEADSTTGEIKQKELQGLEDGKFDVIVNAYAMQVTDEINTVEKAYAAYEAQWGDGGGYEGGDNSKTVTVSNSDELASAIANLKPGETTKIRLADGEYKTNFKIDGGNNVTISGSENAVLSGQIATTSSDAGTLTLRGVTYKVESIQDSTDISQTGSSAIALWGTQTVICENVTFKMSVNNTTAITSWWDTGKGTTIIVKDCTFNCNGQRPIRATGHVTVENSTFNDPYRYAVQLTAKTSTATEMDKAIINFKNNTIVDGANGKPFVYGIQLEGEEYGCNDLVINGSGNTIVDGGADSTMYYCECGKVDHATIEWNTEVGPVHKESTTP